MSHKTGIIIEPEHSKLKGPHELVMSYYPANLQTALMLISSNGQPGAKCTVCINSPLAKIPSGDVWLKGWSENEGIPEDLEDAGVLSLTGEQFSCGFSFAQRALLSLELVNFAHAHLEHLQEGYSING